LSAHRTASAAHGRWFLSTGRRQIRFREDFKDKAEALALAEELRLLLHRQMEEVRGKLVVVPPLASDLEAA
jgi:hypothetical protein